MVCVCRSSVSHLPTSLPATSIFKFMNAFAYIFFLCEKIARYWVWLVLRRVCCNRPAVHSFNPFLYPRLFRILHQIKNHIQTTPPNDSVILRSYRNAIIRFTLSVPAGSPLVPPPVPTLAEIKNIILANWPTLVPLDHSRCYVETLAAEFEVRWGLFIKGLDKIVIHINPFLVQALETEPQVCQILLQFFFRS